MAASCFSVSSGSTTTTPSALGSASSAICVASLTSMMLSHTQFLGASSSMASGTETTPTWSELMANSTQSTLSVGTAACRRNAAVKSYPSQMAHR